MSLCDCEICWDTPCHCGWNYRNFPEEFLESQIVMLKKLIAVKKEHPIEDINRSNFLPLMDSAKI